MSAIKLYIATSLDGFIARENGELDWLYALPNPQNIDHGYTAFHQTIDTVIMGRATYEQILGFGVDWPYPDCQTYVLSADPNYQPKTERTKTLHQIKAEQMEQIKVESQSNIWVVGGGKVITAMMNDGLVDEMILSIIPIILGRGIRLFPNHPKETLFTLTHSESFETGVVNLSYTKK
jgi:dihydrofolate reductase